MELGQVMNQMLVLFMIMVVGYIANKSKIISEESNSVLCKVILYVTNPALIISSATSEAIHASTKEIWEVLGIAMLFYLALPILAKIITWIIPISKSNRNLYQAMYIFTNLGFMGIPVASVIFGSEAVFYITIFMIPFNLLIFSYGILLISSSNGKIDIKKALNPSVISAVLALLIFTLQIPLPTCVKESATMIGGITSPLAMIVVGSVLATIKVKDVLLDFRPYVYSVIKLLVIPITVYFIFSLFISNKILLGSILITAGMPVATNVTIICNEFGGNSRVVTKATFISTILSLITIPLLVYCII